MKIEGVFIPEGVRHVSAQPIAEFTQKSRRKKYEPVLGSRWFFSLMPALPEAGGRNTHRDFKSHEKVDKQMMLPQTDCCSRNREECVEIRGRSTESSDLESIEKSNRQTKKGKSEKHAIPIGRICDSTTKRVQAWG